MRTTPGGCAPSALVRGAQADARAAEAVGVASQVLARVAQARARLAALPGPRRPPTRLRPGPTVEITFGFDRWALDDRGATALLETVRQLQEDPDRIVLLEGRTDRGGSEDHDPDLSQRRAESVRRFLVARGLDVPRIHAIGLGDLRPETDNPAWPFRGRSRRVAVRVLEPAE